MRTRPTPFTLREWQLLRLIVDDHESSEVESGAPKGAGAARVLLTKIDAHIAHMNAAKARSTTPKGTTP